MPTFIFVCGGVQMNIKHYGYSHIPAGILNTTVDIHTYTFGIKCKKYKATVYIKDHILTGTIYDDTKSVVYKEEYVYNKPNPTTKEIRTILFYLVMDFINR